MFNFLVSLNILYADVLRIIVDFIDFDDDIDICRIKELSHANQCYLMNSHVSTRRVSKHDYINWFNDNGYKLKYRLPLKIYKKLYNHEEQKIKILTKPLHILMCSRISRIKWLRHLKYNAKKEEHNILSIYRNLFSKMRRETYL